MTAPLRAWPGSLPVQNLYTAGKAGEVFFRALRDRGVILGSPCASCRITYVPARLFCERCFAELTETRPVGPGGRVEAFTVCHRDGRGGRAAKPVVLAAVRLAGAGTVLIHRLRIDPAKARIGLKVRTVLEPARRRRGSILDIRYFAP